MLSTVSIWDNAVMNGLSVQYEITVHRDCVNSGYDWRSRDLKPDLAQSFRKCHVKDRNALKAREAMLSYYRARIMRPHAEIPTKESDYEKFQAVPSDQNPPNSAAVNPRHFLLSPDHLQSVFSRRNDSIRENMMQFLASVPDSPVPASVDPIAIPEYSNPGSVNSEFVESSAQRAAGLEALRRNAEINHEYQLEAESGDSSDDEDHDWGANGDRSSDEESF